MSKQRDFEDSLVTNLGDKLTYGRYLDLDRLLSAQRPRSSPEHHDELLFIIQHQTTELWLKLIGHELADALDAIAGDDVERGSKVLARVRRVQEVLYEQWGVLETLTPSEYVQFRDVLGPASGFQSVQYRQLEFTLGNKDARMIDVHRHDPAAVEMLETALHRPSLYDAFLRFCSRRGLAVPAEVLERDVTAAHVEDQRIVDMLVGVYRDPGKYWDVYELGEKLMDLEESLSLWRFRHMKVVMRIIGFKQGTGGSSGVPFLQKMVGHT
ncbi:MAG: tryptophan 2,3-dioxygenase family protein, partial [Planctomycetota bacterium]